ncbi:hypothetical protein VP424E501_P0027 [Vibrio phage 424E50-1]|nr:hypothetical protein VP424E501_P0027 [Vibrio phage 424E50-1]
MFTKAGFEWLLKNKDKLDSWVERQKAIEKVQKKVPC